jgi:NAD(P)-dependent dehydrogenase (short-subunit alcohol dehydrogenase family)
MGTSPLEKKVPVSLRIWFVENRRGTRAAYSHLDVVSELDWQEAVQATVDTLGGLDIIVNNAGVFADCNVSWRPKLAARSEFGSDW